MNKIKLLSTSTSDGLIKTEYGFNLEVVCIQGSNSIEYGKKYIIGKKKTVYDEIYYEVGRIENGEFIHSWERHDKFISIEEFREGKLNDLGIC